MAPKRNWSDDEIVKIVFDYRAENGACSYEDICAATGMTKTPVAQRVDRLVREGRLLQSHKRGSIRGADEVMMRDVGGRLIEVKARKRRSKTSR